ncbi:hypothetical protein T265_10737 [Opisthorchis viverrini]|uniref:Uncharacterized protein n=1 Tax=Opisthorchis viverrini TaxID=6198 RepID=A0A074Z1F0_OPIVI|nr:hypothetical protein T265_10737 [Opisthorchis viverrini]KER20798.1 hypothetical protein T265_10737 [Opisthorchis viverrini]
MLFGGPSSLQRASNLWAASDNRYNKTKEQTKRTKKRESSLRYDRALMMPLRLMMKRLRSNCQARRAGQQPSSSPQCRGSYDFLMVQQRHRKSPFLDASYDDLRVDAGPEKTLINTEVGPDYALKVYERKSAEATTEIKDMLLRAGSSTTREHKGDKGSTETPTDLRQPRLIRKIVAMTSVDRNIRPNG